MQAQRDAGSPVYDSARFVARARLLTEWIEPPTIAANDKCDIMGETLGGHVNTCDEWRPNGDHQVEIGHPLTPTPNPNPNPNPQPQPRPQPQPQPQP